MRVAHPPLLDTRSFLLVAFLVFVACTNSCVALPTYPSSSVAVRDTRVAELRTALLAQHGLDRLPDPPHALGIHTACKKFGRGCPDTYVTFLENTLASVTPAADERTVDVAEASAVLRPVSSLEVKPAAEQVTAAESPKDDRCLNAPGVSPVALMTPGRSASHTLRLPLQPSWTYDQHKQLEGILTRIKVAEIHINRSGVNSHAVQLTHHVPRGAGIVLHNDADGTIAASLTAACQRHRAASHAERDTGAAQSVEESSDSQEAWCRFMEHRQGRTEDTLSCDSQTATSSVADLPPPPFACHAVRLSRWYVQLLLSLDPLLRSAWGWTWRVAVPSAVITSVALWVYTGAGWSDGVEHAIFDSAHENTQDGADSPAHATASGNEESSEEQEMVVADRSHHCSRLAALRFTFIERALHRSWYLCFLRLRLVLLLLVALDLLWNVAQTLYVTWWPSAVQGGTRSSTDVMPFPLSMIWAVLPVWLHMAFSVYVIAGLQGTVLVMAVKNALDAYGEWQDVSAECAAEQEYLLRAAHDASLLSRGAGAAAQRA